MSPIYHVEPLFVVFLCLVVEVSKANMSFHIRTPHLPQGLGWLPMIIVEMRPKLPIGIVSSNCSEFVIIFPYEVFITNLIAIMVALMTEEHIYVSGGIKESLDDAGQDLAVRIFSISSSRTKTAFVNRTSY